MRIFVVGGAIHYANFIKGASLVNNLEDAELVLFTGGEDVDPSMYDCKKHSTTYSNIKRDLQEKEIFEQINPNKQICLGICRGSQFLCVMNKGLLVQNCNNHALSTTHGIKSIDNQWLYEITSTHHQMQCPYNLNKADYDILYVAEKNRSEIYCGDKIRNYTDDLIKVGEPEIVLYHKKNLPVCLAVQGHPEMIPNSPVSDMINNLIKKLLK